MRVLQKEVSDCGSGGCKKPRFVGRQRCGERGEKMGIDVAFNAEKFGGESGSMRAMAYFQRA